MRIQINDLILDNVVVFDEKNRLLIKSETIDLLPLLQAIKGDVTINEVDDDGNVVWSIESAFNTPHLVVRGSTTTLVCPKVIAEKELDRFNEMEGEITAIRNNISEQLVPLSIMFVQMSQDGTLDDITISEHPDLFPEWTENWTGKAGTILREGDTLYRSIHDITTTAQNTKPSETPSMWTMVADPTDEYPMWVQPIGAHDAYSIGDKVSHNDKNWISTTDGNVWEPGVYGWEVAE